MPILFFTKRMRCKLNIFYNKYLIEVYRGGNGAKFVTLRAKMYSPFPKFAIDFSF